MNANGERDEETSESEDKTMRNNLIPWSIINHQPQYLRFKEFCMCFHLHLGDCEFLLIKRLFVVI